jgi:hypothetical protein
MVKNKRQKKNWSEEDVRILAYVVSRYAQLHRLPDLQRLTPQHWQDIATLIPGVTAQACMFRWLSLRKVNLAACHWTEAEGDCLLRILREQHGSEAEGFQAMSVDWRRVSEQLYSECGEGRVFRSAKQCR